MSSVVLDADGLIKLTKAGLVPVLARQRACWIAEEVFQETAGREALDRFPDAAAIRDYVDGGVIRRAKKAPAVRLPAEWPAHALGEGEEATWRLFTYGRHTHVLTDDRVFFRFLGGRGDRVLNSTAALVWLYEQGALSRNGAIAAVDRLRSMIDRERYLSVRSFLERRA